MNTTVNHRSALIRWEITWIAVELSVTAAGLWLMLGAGLTDLGSGVMFLLVALSLFIRWQHYAGVVHVAS